MEPFKAALVVLATLSLANALHTLLPVGKEVIYDYKAVVKAGTHLPVSHVSQFLLHGKLHVQSNTNSSIVKLSDLKYQLYNGVQDHVHEHEAHDVPLPQEVHDLEKAFKIIYNIDGHVLGIVTDKEEHEYTRNIKKAIAAVMQIDNDWNKHKKHHAFTTEERSIYGQGEVVYNIIPHKNDVIEVQKLHHSFSTSHMYQYRTSNTFSLGCDVPAEDPILHDSQRKYIIVKEDGHDVVKHVFASGVIAYHPYQAKSDAQFIMVNQTMHWMNAVPVQQEFTVQNEHFEDDLTYNMFTGDLETKHASDLTHGRHQVIYDKLIPQVMQMLQDSYQYMHEDHLHMNFPDLEHGQLINRIQRMLMQFDVEHLEQIHATLKGKNTPHDVKILHIFYHILPLVGTRHSALVIKDWVVKKQIDEHIAVDLLQQLPSHIVHVTAELVKELEVLANLDQDIPWSVRKVAIINFGTLINYAQKHHERHPHHAKKAHEYYDYQPVFDEAISEDAKLFDKYITQFIEHAKAATEYKVQQTYLAGLFNMRLHSIAEHLLPAIRGDWWASHHLRFWALWAISPALIEHRTNTFETVWPIFSNYDEHTELRIAAYLIIMKSDPNLSTLTNMYWALLREPNDEVYHFHYTFVHSMMRTTDHCMQAFALRLAQVMKYMPPPSHGSSHMDFYDYTDVNFGFSGGFTTLGINTNDSEMLAVTTTSQLFNRNYEDYEFYVKVHGHRLFGLVQGEGPTVPPKDMFLEVAILKQQHVLNTYYFDARNVHELADIVKLFKDDEHTLTKKLLHISYERYHKVAMPTDLGIPALWEYLVPVVHKNDINIVKQLDQSNKHLTVNVDNRYVRWMHYRHGLSFYNPIVDVWQGINRYHAYDAVLPVHLSISFDSQQKSVKLSWKKHDEIQKDVAGVRSHVNQMVFIKDDYERNLLAQSTPKAENWIVVSHGEQYRHNYTLLEEDDLNTGHKWHVAVYDSDQHISNGSWKHALEMLRQPQHKNFENPLQYALLTFDNWDKVVRLLPRPGVHGLLVRWEPSQEHAVSNIDLTIKFNLEQINKEKQQVHAHAPASKITTRWTWAVKNKEQALKTWDIDSVIDMNDGHTINNLKMQWTRIVPGKKDYKICVDGVKKWTPQGVTGHLNVAMSQSADGKCVKDDTVVDITMVGELSHEQTKEHHMYGACQYIVPYSVPHFNTLHCLASHASLRHYVYNVKSLNVPTEFKKTLAQWWDTVKSHYMSYYSYEDEHFVDIGEHNLKIDVVYPMQGNEIDVHVTTPSHLYKLEGVPTHQLQWWGAIPDNVMYPWTFLYLHNYNHVDHYVIHPDHQSFNDFPVVHKNVPKDWTLYVGDTEQGKRHAVYVKHNVDELAVKIEDHSHVVEIVPQDGHHKVTLDGKAISWDEQHQHHEDWVHVLHIEEQEPHSVVVYLPLSGLHVEFNGQHVTVIAPRYGFRKNVSHQ